MLLTLNDVIHPEVRKLHPASRPPDFVHTSTDPDDFVAEPPCRSKLPSGSISPLTPPGHLGRHWP